jgi:dihydroxyacetone kinase-like protein
MKKLINGTDTLLGESLDGFAAAHGDIVVLGEERKFVRRRTLKRGKVGLISGGGSGHEPLHAGLVGLGMLDAACPGEVFTSPTPDKMLAAAEAVETGAGILFDLFHRPARRCRHAGGRAHARRRRGEGR